MTRKGWITPNANLPHITALSEFASLRENSRITPPFFDLLHPSFFALSAAAPPLHDSALL
jgi:hypothetical protein